jgi:YidC/Oxa1 family membrane protein insertase
MDRRFLAAMLLSMLVIFAYSSYNMKLRQDYIREHPEYLEKLAQQQQERAGDVAEATPELLPESTPSDANLVTAATGSQELQRNLPKTEETVLVRSPLYQVEIAAQGGRPVSWKLLKFQEMFADLDLLENYRKKLAAEADSPWLRRMRIFLDRKIERNRRLPERLKEESPKADGHGSWNPAFAADAVPTLWDGPPPLNLKWNGIDLDDFIAYEPTADEVNVQDGSQTLQLRGTNGPFEITKSYTFYPDDYAIGYSVAVRNISSSTLSFPADFKDEQGLSLTWENGVGLDLFNDSWTPPVYFHVSNSIKAEGDLAKDQAKGENPIPDWALIQSKYFGAFIVPDGKVVPRVVRKRDRYDHGSLDLILDLPKLGPSEQKQQSFTIYVGPKDPPHLLQFGHDADDILFLGYFRRMAKPFGVLFGWLLHLIQSLVGNWGVAIIVLTIVTKVAMYPLMRKQMQSMKNMQRIQPLAKELEHKYKDNQAKYQKELMALYRREKVNPAGGCLPLLLTMPIFIALYVVIYIAPELRGAPFFLWIRDLSQPDTLFSFYLPGLNWVVPFNLLPVVNGVVQYFSTRKQVIDPKQAGMMHMMPINFVFIFWNFPSGLVLYWIVQAVLGTLQQSLFNYLHEKNNARGKASQKPTGPVAAREARRAKK